MFQTHWHNYLCVWIKFTTSNITEMFTELLKHFSSKEIDNEYMSTTGYKYN